MTSYTRILLTLTTCSLPLFQSSAQRIFPPRLQGEADPCGFPDTSTLAYKTAASANWGYGYDSLRVDLLRWSTSPFVRIDSVGPSVQNRALYLLTIEDTAALPVHRKRIWIHARTHPNEVQGTWVTNQLITFLLSDVTLARELRDSCVFNIMPMYNPDGVELMKPRENANGVDIESNWAAVPGEQEVQVLRATLTRLMSTSNPIRIALNVHSAYDCTRYFVYHAVSGTSPAYAAMEQHFITSVGNNFLGGFQPWDYFVSWTTGAPTYYPESWFWYNYHESVLALTYEDMNCLSAGEFDLTAEAILAGVWEFLFAPTSVASNEIVSQSFVLSQNYPNPFNGISNFGFRLPASGQAGIAESGYVTLKVFDVVGREVATLVDEVKAPGKYTVAWDASGCATGIYFARLRLGSETKTINVVLLR